MASISQSTVLRILKEVLEAWVRMKANLGQLLYAGSLKSATRSRNSEGSLHEEGLAFGFRVSIAMRLGVLAACVYIISKRRM